VVTDLAPGILSAGSDARVSAVEIEASQVLGALSVILTLSFLAGDKRISLKPSRTFAGGRAASRDALRVGSARVGVARIRLLLAACDGVWAGDISSNTLAHRVAQVVHVAPGVWSARAGEARVRRGGPRLYLATPSDGVWLGREPSYAGTDWVSKSVGIALCVWPARCGVARVWPRDTLVVLADLTPATVRVSLTLPATPGDCVWLGDIVREAAADWVPGACDHALGVWSAGRGVTWVRLLNTLVVLTDESCAAVRVSLTLSLAAGDCVGHWDVASQAAADWVAQAVGHAAGVGSAGRWVTRVRLDHALIVPADISGAAVRVPHTFPGTASDCVRCRDIPGLALADRVPAGVGAEGVWATRAGLARVRLDDTFLIAADKTSLAVRVSDTLGSATCYGIRFWDQTWLTTANRVASKVDSAHSPWSARRWVARIWFFNTLLILAYEASLTVRVNDTLRFAA